MTWSRGGLGGGRCCDLVLGGGGRVLSGGEGRCCYLVPGWVGGEGGGCDLVLGGREVLSGGGGGGRCCDLVPGGGKKVL